MPSPALALRQSEILEQQGGLEQLKQALGIPTSPAAGAEENAAEEVVDQLAQVAERSDGVLVITQSGLEENSALLMKLARHPEFSKRMIIVFNALVATAQLARFREFGVQVIDEKDFEGLVIALLSTEKAGRVSVLERTGELTQKLAQALPPSIWVIHLMAAQIEKILASFVEKEKLDQLDPRAMEALATLSAA